MTGLEIILTDSTNSAFQKLSSQLEEELYLRDGLMAEENRILNQVDELPTVLILFEHQIPVACGGFRKYNSYSAEIKRMYVAPAHRRKKRASLILHGLEDLASQMDFRFCMLETGRNQPEAIDFYQKNGYSQIQNFGKYAGHANSICFRKVLPAKSSE